MMIIVMMITPGRLGKWLDRCPDTQARQAGLAYIPLQTRVLCIVLIHIIQNEQRRLLEPASLLMKMKSLGKVMSCKL